MKAFFGEASRETLAERGAVLLSRACSSLQKYIYTCRVFARACAHPQIRVSVYAMPVRRGRRYFTTRRGKRYRRLAQRYLLYRRRERLRYANLHALHTQMISLIAHRHTSDINILSSRLMILSWLFLPSLRSTHCGSTLSRPSRLFAFKREGW